MGVVLYAVHVVRYRIVKSRQTQKRRHLPPEEKQALARDTEYFQHMVPFIIVMGVSGFVGIWYVHGTFPTLCAHFLVLMSAYLILGYVHISIRDKITRAPPSAILRKPREGVRLLTRTFEKVLYVNGLALLLFCMWYARSEYAPSQGIGGIIVWILVLGPIYSAILLTDFFLQIEPVHPVGLVDYAKSWYKKTMQVIMIAASWIIALWWLKSGTFFG